MFLCPPPRHLKWGGGGGHIVSPLSVRTYVPYVHNIGFRSLCFERINLLDSYVIHKYIIIKYRSSSNLCKIHPLLWELWPLFNYIVWLKMVSIHYLLKRLVYWIHTFYTGIYNHKIQVKFDLGIIHLLLWELIAPFWFYIRCFVRSLEFHIRSITTLWIFFMIPHRYVRKERSIYNKKETTLTYIIVELSPLGEIQNYYCPV